MDWAYQLICSEIAEASLIGPEASYLWGTGFVFWLLFQDRILLPKMRIVHFLDFIADFRGWRWLCVFWEQEWGSNIFKITLQVTSMRASKHQYYQLPIRVRIVRQATVRTRAHRRRQRIRWWSTTRRHFALTWRHLVAHWALRDRTSPSIIRHLNPKHQDRQGTCFTTTTRHPWEGTSFSLALLHWKYTCLWSTNNRKDFRFMESKALHW